MTRNRLAENYYTVDLPHYKYHKCSNTQVEMDWKVITINVFYIQLLNVGFYTNDDKSVPNILLSFSASIQMILFSESVAFGKTTRF